MARTVAPRKYGRKPAQTKAEQLFAELPQSPLRNPPATTKAATAATESSENHEEKEIEDLAEDLLAVKIKDGEKRKPRGKKTLEANKNLEVLPPSRHDPQPETEHDVQTASERHLKAQSTISIPSTPTTRHRQSNTQSQNKPIEVANALSEDGLRVLTWADVCPPGDTIVKIAEASYAEVYRVSNDRGTSVIKVIRLESPVKPKTKTQTKAGLVDEEPRAEADVRGELQISEWLADIPGFVVYKERYVVKGKATKHLLETHQAFQRRMKRQDPGRAQFYPSPSRYLEETKFLVVELGDAGKALEDWKLETESQIWDIFFLEAIALARAEEMAMFEHRDLHEGNLCIKQVSAPRDRPPESTCFFGYSGLDITILDYGLSRAEDLSIDFAKPIANDLERDLSVFTSTHAPQCKVYRQMRSFLLRADRKCLAPEEHTTPYAKGIDGPLSWEAYAPYTNVLWLAYLYEYLTTNFVGGERELKNFKRETAELWKYLNPNASEDMPCFGSAADIVCFAVEAGWISGEQLMDGCSMLEEHENSIILSRDDRDEDVSLVRRSPRRRQTAVMA